MTADYIRDILFDFINESDDLDVRDVHWDRTAEALRLTAQDGSVFYIRIEAQ